MAGLPQTSVGSGFCFENRMLEHAALLKECLQLEGNGTCTFNVEGFKIPERFVFQC